MRAGDVPDILAGKYFIDVSDTNARRSRHAFHHELWHMADFTLRVEREGLFPAKALEAPDPEASAPAQVVLLACSHLSVLRAVSAFRVVAVGAAQSALLPLRRREGAARRRVHA